jgi:hypothetical protein
MVKSLILVILGGGLLWLAVLRLRQYRLKERYALVFLLLGLPFLGLAVWPNAIDYFSHFMDIDYRTMTLLCVTTFLTLAVFELLTIVSRQDQKINSLAQLVGILMEKQKLADPEHRPVAQDGVDDPTRSKREAA